MIKLVKIKDPSLKLAFLTQFSPKDSRFVLSDIKNKVFLSSQLFKKHNFLEGPCVLRANEFYQSLFESLNTRWTIQSNPFIKALLAEFLSQNPSHRVKNLAYSQVFFEFLDSSFPFFLNAPKIFEEWFLNKTQTVFPHYWLDPAQKFCELLQSKNTAPESAVKALLLDQLLYAKKLKFNSKNLVLDLSFSLDFCEKEIFKELSKHTELFVIGPWLETLETFTDQDFCLYKEWEKELNKQQVLFLSQELSEPASQDSSSSSSKPETLVQTKPSSAQPKPATDKNLTFDPLNFFSSQPESKSATNLKLSPAQPKPETLAQAKPASKRETAFFKVESESQWMELKKALTQVRQWLNQGISPQQIALYAPNIEDYWFALKSYLQKESLPFKKSLQAPCLDFPQIQYVLSALRLHLGILSFEDLETFCFYKASKKNFSDIQSRHFKVLNKETLQPFLFKEKLKDPKQKISGSQFVPWVLSFCPANIQQKTLEALSSVLSQLSLNESLSYSSWLKLFEELLSLQKITEQEEQEGLSCLSFNAFHSNKSPYVFLLGLTESAFQSHSLINESTAKSLLNDLGIPVSFQPSQKKQKNLLWFLQSSHLKEVYLSSYLYNFQGEIQNKSLIFMTSPKLYSAKNQAIKVCLNYDMQQKGDSFSKRLKGKSQKDILFLQKAFQTQDEKIFPVVKGHLSPSQIKKYRDCPFKYAADKLFYVPENQTLARELSVLEQGSSVHKLFKELLSQYPQLKLSEKQKDELVLQVLPKDQHFVHKKQKLLTQKYLKQKLNEFLKIEQKQQEALPSLKPVALEVELKGFWDQKKGELSHQGDYIFKAFVDRVDQDQETKNYGVRDYKASSTRLTHIKSWLKEGQEDLQLIFYAQALQKGLISQQDPNPVFSVFYSAYNDEFKAKGFVEEAHPCSDIINKGRDYKQSAEVLQEAIIKTNQSVKHLVNRMEKGDFKAQPQKKELCQKCHYNKWCRFYV